MCGGYHAHLTTNWRSKGSPELVDLYSGLYGKTDEELPFVVQDAQAKFPLKVSPIDVDIVLCVSHALRIRINMQRHEAKAYKHEAEGGHTTHIEWAGDDIK